MNQSSRLLILLTTLMSSSRRVVTQNLPIGMVVHAHDKSSIRLPILSELYAVAQTMRWVRMRQLLNFMLY